MPAEITWYLAQRVLLPRQYVFFIQSATPAIVGIFSVKKEHVANLSHSATISPVTAHRSKVSASHIPSPQMQI
jgi:hypothetical protein